MTRNERISNAILDVETSVLSDGKIRLKYLAISGYIGPELIMPRSLAETTIHRLTEALKHLSEQEPK